MGGRGTAGRGNGKGRGGGPFFQPPGCCHLRGGGRTPEIKRGKREPFASSTRGEKGLVRHYFKGSRGGGRVSAGSSLRIWVRKRGPGAMHGEGEPKILRAANCTRLFLKKNAGQCLLVGPETCGTRRQGKKFTTERGRYERTID